MHVKTLPHRTRFRTQDARLKILTVIARHIEADFTEIDIYKSLLARQEKISIYTVNNNLKQLSGNGFLVVQKTNIAARLYKKSGNFEKLLSTEEFKPYLFN